jgi:hypothetical protein
MQDVMYLQLFIMQNDSMIDFKILKGNVSNLPRQRALWRFDYDTLSSSSSESGLKQSAVHEINIRKFYSSQIVHIRSMYKIKFAIHQ